MLGSVRVLTLSLYAVCFGITAASSPILIVPGILGNQLQAKLDKDYAPHEWCSTQSDWYTAWLSLEQLVPLVVDCFLNNSRMLFNDGKYSNSEGVQVRVPGFGDTDTVEHLDPEEFLIPYFHDFVKLFTTKHGYVKGVSIRAAPYDWRFSPDLLQQSGYYDNLQNLTETMYKDNNNTRVTLVTHSLGSPTTLYFLTQIASQDWKDKYLNAFVPLSGIWKGAAKGVLAVTSGNPDGIPIEPHNARYLERKFPANYFLMPVPDPKIWSSTDPMVVTPEKNYTVFDYQALFNDMDYQMGYAQYQVLPTFLTELAPPNVTTYCYYGTQVHTPLTLVYKEGEFPNKQPTVLKGNGDGTVNEASLEACSTWKAAQPSYDVELRSFPGVSHFDMVTDSGVLQAVMEIVTS